MKTPLALTLAAGLLGPVHAEDWLEQVDQALQFDLANGAIHLGIDGLLDLEGYYVDGLPPGLLFMEDNFQFQPRFSLFLDAHIGKHVYAMAQARADRGFDPGAVPRGSVRMDEYLVRYTPLDSPALNLQLGKFATVFGNWVPRHDSWQNPFINAPLPYERVVTITDPAAPGNPAAFLSRRTKPDSKGTWIPVIWGPAYTSGGSIFGSVDKWDYAVELKNASISSRPFVWDGTDLGWENPTVSARLGYRPNASITVGGSVSHGTYLLPSARPTLPQGRDIGDFNQTTVGTDLRVAWKHWEFWAEAIAARFDVPNVGQADTLTYYIETRYRFTPRWFGALRWNQQLFDDVPNGLGGHEAWDEAAWRTDIATGYRFSRHIQAKLQYSYNHQEGPLQQGEQMVATQLTFKF